jgi:hypothetical protein
MKHAISTRYIFEDVCNRYTSSVHPVPSTLCVKTLVRLLHLGALETDQRFDTEKSHGILLPSAASCAAKKFKRDDDMYVLKIHNGVSMLDDGGQ